MTEDEFVPYVPPDKVLPELTFKVIIIGAIITIVMAAANAYLGLYAGMTVSATIPALVIAVAIMRPLNGSILETNLTKAMAVTGEALAAGVIFTFPALLVLHEFTNGAAGWDNLMDHIPEMMAGSFIGGVLGIILTIPLRKVMIIDLNLPYPEGVASAEVLIATEKGGKGMNYIAGALGLGAMFKFASTSFGLNIWHEKLEAAPESSSWPYGGINLSPALLGVGYILGMQIAKLVFIGGVIGWLILNPIVGFAKGYPAGGVDGVYAIWESDIMYIGIGAITTGGIYTLIKLRKPIVEGIKKSMGSAKSGETGRAGVIRTEYDLPWKLWYFVAIGIAMFAMYWWITNSVVVTVVAVPVLLVAAFFFTAVAGYLAGILGSSNNPISGVTVTTLLFTAMLMAAIGAEKNMGMTATIIVGAVVCCSAAIAGDSMQELKTGQLVGATPYNIQIVRFIGVIIAALLIPLVVAIIIQAYGIMNGPGDYENPLAAPQATVMAAITQGIFLGKMNWGMFAFGVLIALVLIWLKLPVMAIAIGIYLPFTLTAPIMIGGIMKEWSDRFIKRKIQLYGDTPPPDESVETDDEETTIQNRLDEVGNKGILMASGLIAGEAIMGVIIAAFVIANVDLTIMGVPVKWPGLIVFLYIGFLITYILLRTVIRDLTFDQIRNVGRSIRKDVIDSFLKF